MSHIEMFKHTQEDWYPSYIVNKGTPSEAKLLRVRILKLNTTPSLWRVCVWGNDDFGMEIDFKYKSLAQICFWTIAQMEYVARAELEEMGFVHA